MAEGRDENRRSRGGPDESRWRSGGTKSGDQGGSGRTALRERRDESGDQGRCGRKVAMKGVSRKASPPCGCHATERRLCLAREDNRRPREPRSRSSHPGGTAAGRRHPGADQAAASTRLLDSRSSRCLSSGAPRSEPRSALHGCGEGLWKPSGPLRSSRCPPVAVDQRVASSAGGACTDEASGPGRHHSPFSDRLRRRGRLAWHPRHQRAPNTRRSGLFIVGAGSRPSLS